MSSETPNATEKAAEAVQRAKLELERAEKFYEDIRRQAAEKIEEIRDRKIGDLLVCTLSAVKKRPGLCLIASATVGFYAGRLLQKMFGK
jgi:ElaB/YqjD/DUF883 family membrane-anchored ribosome-binding protein